ncbi:phosphate propanoyltransferase [Neobacillus sp. DY30]|uniref:phosphate propanoyltransferase n=1 Tax=Neobacillus sp. DY30 TaxID=3047871 RepID=UPI0024BF3681|nr:phosphate propanoyltransferase [Neobacillus sp. DY30]WHY02518.1 phosphate propanoyltransferase [Neobacillus sp. DY30]
MDKYGDVLKLLIEAVKSNISLAEVKEVLTSVPVEWKEEPVYESSFNITVGVSNRHIHLSLEHLYTLFGEGYQLHKVKDLSQPGQYACKETLTICGPKGAIEKVRILGPCRSKTQVEILEADSYKLGRGSEPRMSGDLTGTPGITLIGPKGSVQLTEGLIVAQRHIHMTLDDAERLGVENGQVVSIEFNGPRGGIFNNVAIRASAASALECHIDTEEANAMGVNSQTKVKIIK